MKLHSQCILGRCLSNRKSNLTLLFLPLISPSSPHCLQSLGTYFGRARIFKLAAHQSVALVHHWLLSTDIHHGAPWCQLPWWCTYKVLPKSNWCQGSWSRCTSTSVDVIEHPLFANFDPWLPIFASRPTQLTISGLLGRRKRWENALFSSTVFKLHSLLSSGMSNNQSTDMANNKHPGRDLPFCQLPPFLPCLLTKWWPLLLPLPWPKHQEWPLLFIHPQYI